MTGVPDLLRRHGPALLRMALWWVALVLVYAGTFRPFMAALQGLSLAAGSKLLLGFIFHVAYGVAGYCCFTGAQWLRQLLVFTALLANGVILEALVPSYMYSHLAGMLLFGLFAAGGVSLGRLLCKFWMHCRSR